MKWLLVLLALAQDPNFRGEVALVHVDAEVLHHSAPLDGLRAEDFRITDNGKTQTIVNFARGEERLDVLLLDTSDSMRAIVKRVADSARSALSALRPGDRVAVMTIRPRFRESGRAMLR